MLSIDKTKVDELLAACSSEYSVTGSLLMPQPDFLVQQLGLEICPEEPVTICGTSYMVPPDLQAAREHLISLREKMGDHLLSEDELRERLDSLRGSD